MGVLSILAATAIWGFSPLYYAQMNDVPTLEVVAHRIVWSLPVVIVYALVSGRTARFLAVAKNGPALRMLTLTTALITINWSAFVYAIQIGQTAELSLGYYIYPLSAVVLGALIFREKVSGLQWLAAAIAGAAVVWLTLRFGSLPWIALVVMASFAIYGVIKKKTDVGPLVGVTWEVLLISPVLIGYLLWIGGGVFGQDMNTTLLLIGSSFFTGVPLVLFAEAAKRLQYSTVGVLFYVNPTLQFVSALLLGEAVTGDRLLAFGAIWVAVAIYCYELRRRSGKAVPKVNLPPMK